ncbi:MAG: class I SAM-dependent methyltransferase [Planctomycetes bacterium]|nr:class I SAM-dependent methyltransferase [Planctomycetota bacterium]MBI3844998.1 class I SAM-dependent methyltransferase [Planctomycetota bacterium]
MVQSLAPLGAQERKLHLGCGRTPIPGWVNLDVMALPGVDVVADLDDCKRTLLPFPENYFDLIMGNHVFEHVRNTLALMEEMHRIAKPDAKFVIQLPYGSSDDAFEDPTHVRPYFINSFAYFSQPAYWRADYGYRGDWQPDRIVLRLKESRFRGRAADQVLEEVMSRRNVVVEMVANLTAVKPIRAPRRELLVAPKIDIQLV